ncbi:SIMPL domain-containing protein [Chloroflexota bacterium]
MNNIMKTMIILAVLATATMCWSGCDSIAPPTTINSSSPAVSLSQQNTGIWVSGEGRVSSAPDIATLNLGIETEATTVKLAQDTAARATNALMGELNGFNIADKDIQTTGFSIYPVRRWLEEQEREVTIAYRVTHQLRVKIRNIDDAGPVIDAVVAAGGDAARLNGISFGLDDPTEAQDQARELALANAEAKAKQLASVAGVRLGAPTYINESSLASPVRYDSAFLAEVAVAQSATPVSPGETETVVSVQVVYSIK